ncbi:MAG: hypothetical protein U0168_29780 [Nannocystaceae bacterium]
MVSLAVVVAAAWLRWGRLQHLDEHTLAQRLLESRGILCWPKIAQRDHEGELSIVCADGKYRFVAQPSCSEGFACAMLHIDAACWDRVPESRLSAD